MNNREIKALMAELAPVIREYVGATIKSFVERIAGLEAELAEAKAQLGAMPVPKGGAAIDPEYVRALVVAEVGKAVIALPPAKDGASVALEDVQPLIDEAVTKTVAALPVPKDGASVDPAEVHAFLVDEVAKAVAALPSAKDGVSVTLEDVQPLIDDAVVKAVSALPVPKPAVGIAEAIIDRSGSLNLTLTDGSVKAVGRVVGADIEPADIDAMVARRVGEIPVPKDGLGFDDLSVEHDGERKIVIKFKRDDVAKEFPVFIPAMIYRGVFSEGRSYDIGDAVTWAGSLWHCDAPTADKPGDTQRAWTLAAKRGRDGRASDKVTVRGKA